MDDRGENIRIDEVECGYKPLAGWTYALASKIEMGPSFHPSYSLLPSFSDSCVRLRIRYSKSCFEKDDRP